MVKYTGLAVMGIVVTLSLFFIKVKKESRQELVRAESELQSGRHREAVLHYERAIMWYTPFSRDVHRSINRLWEIGDQAEASRDDSLALYAYRSLRASLYSIRSFYQPYQDWIAKCDVRIVNLMAIEKAGPNAQPAEIEKHRARYAHMHARKLGPKLGGVILTEIGFFGWVGATLGLIWYGLSSQGNWLWRPCVWWGSGVVLFLTTWVIGLLLA
ncbi:MAG: hypothetical protein ETSY1_38470 [Candidatus Entotheonella factor]|uniref:Uncharacterized protein n=1 Tax=Entotheonella factor TaxID=1429438 RepID=W4L7E1_ENTF1|nr:MAG: hypothetical protein ETSY1_38470 [Candidatus Entotheonella factor]